MLSHEEARRLQAIEQQIRDEDPAFVRRFRRRTGSPAAVLRRARTIAVRIVLGVLVALGMLVGTAGLLVGSVALALTGFSLAGVAVQQLQRTRRHRRH